MTWLVVGFALGVIVTYLIFRLAVQTPLERDLIFEMQKRLVTKEWLESTRTRYECERKAREAQAP